MSEPYTQLIPLDRYNWELCIDIQLTPEQAGFVPSVLYSLAQSAFEDLHSFGIQYRGEMVGFAMYGEFGGICWINRIMVDKAHQGQGIGSSALQNLLSLLHGKVSCREIRTSIARHNEAAFTFFENAGFSPLEDALGEELVLRYEGKSLY